MEFTTNIIPLSVIDESQKIGLFKLQQEYYDNVKPEIFFKDLKNKDWIILIKDQSGNPLGFSTIQLIWLNIKSINHLFLFSGDTIMKEEIRNSPVLAGAFAHFMLALIENYSVNPIHWFLISKGYRTYRFLPVYFNEYYPVYNKEIPSEYREIMDAIALFKFGDEYNSESNIIHYKNEMDRLKPEFAQIPEGKLKDPDIRFFYEKNPLFYQGDEMVCITDIKISNFKPLVDRIVKYTKVNFTWK